MKKIIGAMVVLLSVTGLFVSAQTRNGLVLTDTQAAINFMYTNGLTKFNTTTSFMAHNNLRRDEAAAFFARFARDVLGHTPNTSNTECSKFTDLSLGHKDLQSEMISSCQLGLFKGSNGKFMPTASFTNAQALTVLIRLIDGEKSENNPNHWAENYWLTAINAGLIEGLAARNHSNLDKNIIRGEVARLIEAGRHYNGGYVAETGDEWNDIDAINNILNSISLDLDSTNNTTEQVETVCTSESDPYITIISPTGGETFKPGEQITVEWESCNLTEAAEVSIGLLSDQPLVNGGRSILIMDTINDGIETITLPIYLGSNMGYVSSGPHYKIHVGSKYNSQADTENIAYAVYSKPFDIYMAFCNGSNVSATRTPLSTQNQTLRENGNVNLGYISITNSDNCPKQIVDIKSSIGSAGSVNQDSLKKIHDNLSFLYYLNSDLQMVYRNEGPEGQVHSGRPQRQIIIMPNSTIKLDLSIFRHTSTIENGSSIRITPVLIDVKDKDGNIYSIQTNGDESIQPILTTE